MLLRVVFSLSVLLAIVCRNTFAINFQSYQNYYNFRIEKELILNKLSMVLHNLK